MFVASAQKMPVILDILQICVYANAIPQKDSAHVKIFCHLQFRKVKLGQSSQKIRRRNVMKEFDYSTKFSEIMERIKEGAFLVVKAKDRMNVMTIGWALFGIVWRRPILMVAVRKTRFTFGIIEEADSFTVSVPTGDMKKESNLCGTKSGRDMDKFKECGLATIPSKKVSTPLLKIAGYHFECRIVCKVPMDPKLIVPDVEALYPAKDYHTLYFGEIAASYVAK